MVEKLKDRHHTHLLNCKYKFKECHELQYRHNLEGPSKILDAVVLNDSHVVKTSVGRSVSWKGGNA